MNKYVYTLLIFCWAGKSAADNSDQLNMFVWSNQLAPVIYLSNTSVNKKFAQLNDYEGIAVDILASFSKTEVFNYSVNLNSRKRGELELYEGNHDFTTLSPSWLDFPNKLIFTLPIYVHREFLYSNQAIIGANLAEVITGKRVCTRLGYKYPNIDPFFKSGLAIQIASQEATGEFKLLRRGRCDLVLTNEFSANTLIRENRWENQIFRSNFTTDEVNYTFAFHPKHSELVERLNHHIREISQNGDLEKFIQQRIPQF